MLNSLNKNQNLLRHWACGLRTFVTVSALAASVALGTTVAVANPSIGEIIPAARAGDTRAQYMAGMSYLFGQGIAQSIPEGARWLQLSARAGLPQAMVALAGLYDTGSGVPYDPERALLLRQQAARAGEATARGQLADDARVPGQRDFRRASILTDLHQYAAAIPYARRADAAGSANAQLLLGRAYHFGMGVPVDKMKAFTLYQKSAAGGLADGNRALAYMYEFGLGVGADRRKALMYYDRAAALGSGLARRAAANLRSPEYNRPRSGGGGRSGSSNSNFQAFQCNGAGGTWNGSRCTERNTNTSLPPQ